MTKHNKMTKHNIRYLPVAEDDLNEIVDYLLEHSQQAASNFVDDLERLEEHLSLFPKTSPLAKDRILRDKGYRTAIVGRYILFYIVDGNDVFVMRIIHGKRNYVDLF